ncbi:MAG: polysaccharide lyase family 8 super-sandwich domain-containing protein, partial [Paludibacter sp.]
ANSEPTGHKTLSYGAAFIHKRDNWIVSLKTASKYQFVRESSDPWVTFFLYGMLEVNNTTWLRYGALKLQSDFGVDGYNWRKMPGTTSVNYSDITKMLNKEYKRFWPKSTFVGGVMQDGNGVFTLQLPASTLNGLSSFTGNKSYFCFDNNIVCVGSNISNTITGDTTITTLFQDAVSSTSLTYMNNSTGFKTTPYNFKSNLTAPTWLVNSHNIAYWLPAGQSLRLTRSLESNPNWLNTASVSGTFATAWIDHGIAPKNASYSYIMRINALPADMITFNTQMQSATPPIKVLALNSQVHAVESVNNSTYAAVVINSAANININDVVSVSKPCVFMVKTTDVNQKKLSLAYPDLDFIDTNLYTDLTYCGYSNPNTIVVKLLGSWTLENPVSQNVSFVSNVNNISTFQFVLKDGLTTDAIIKKNITTVEAIEAQSEPIIVVYPNEISITFPTDSWKNAKGQIVSMDGKIMCELNFKDSITKISTNNYRHGVYLVILKGNNDMILKKVVK